MIINKCFVTYAANKIITLFHKLCQLHWVPLKSVLNIYVQQSPKSHPVKNVPN